jgi:hypothetical protein
MSTNRTYGIASVALLFVIIATLVGFVGEGWMRARAAEVTSTLAVGGSKIDVTYEAAPGGVGQEDLLAWVKAAAESVAGYYGKFPVQHLTLRINSFGGHGVRHGMTWGMHGGLIKIGVGDATTRAELMDDWMLTHEMIHLAFPSMADEHHWIEEGISTYVEPVARIRAGKMDEMSMWRDIVRDMPKGQPAEGDEGLDRTHTWGRTYWGGALFCLDADVSIRRATGNKKGLQDALRAILNAGGDITQDWEITRAFKVGDAATGTTVLEDLYGQMKDKAVTVDLAGMWKELGVEKVDGSVKLNDGAPGAGIRKAIVGGESVKAAEAVFVGRRRTVV